ncbi:Transcriptional regulator, TetR family [Thioalkalivibrio nitratireducens DSM 14787]|uniref:Transcriptional regulator, TetR family n=1 Tax=Thioalkalivibrio nitratireducens (strain DSM 14787 / UNIQEM 213 / ALEN2) TaxID=1255043 RepID=L0E0H4_THIND|nr:TetR/AcrR family transcriptional regulator [Thioalkalivibrio nitratireducens]AGA34715.1 Transcriptional regulator, TetR family [Thioalkalivibrio nitratireducens DSM 14787]
MDTQEARPDTRSALLHAARELIFTRSFEHVGTAEICEQAGVHKGSLYHFFRSKETLVLAMLDDLMRDFERDVLVPSLATPEPIRAQIDAFVRAVHAFQAAVHRETGHLPGCPFGNLIVETGTYSSGLRQAIKQHLDRIAGYFQRSLQTAVERAELPAHTDTRTLAEHWLTLMEGILVMAKVDQDPATILRLGPALHVLLGVPGAECGLRQPPHD